MKDMQRMTEQAKGSGARVLLVSTNRERQPYPVVPNGLACVASALDAAGHRVRFLDLCFAPDPVASARSAAVDFKPDIIGVSVRNIDNSDAIALRHYTPEARNHFARAPEGSSGREKSSRGVRRLELLPKHCFAISASTTQWPEMASARASPS